MTTTRPSFPDVGEGLIDQAQATLDAVEALWPRPVTVGPFVVTTDHGGAAHARCQTDTVDVQVTVDARPRPPRCRGREWSSRACRAR